MKLLLIVRNKVAAEVVALLTNPQNRGDAESQMKDVQVAARTLGGRLVVVGASTEPELERSFSALAESGAGAVVVQNDPFTIAPKCMRGE
jgi:hypothetical protein